MSERYFQLDYDEIYYVFDSEEVNKEEVLEAYEYGDFSSFGDSMNGLKVVERLNQQDHEIINLKAQLTSKGDVCKKCEHGYLKPTKDNIFNTFIRKCTLGHDECSKHDLKYCEDFNLTKEDIR